MRPLYTKDSMVQPKITAEVMSSEENKILLESAHKTITEEICC